MSSVLSREVLVLNKGWTAIGIVSLERAIIMLFGQYKDGTPKAKIIDAHDFQQYTWADWSRIKPKNDDDIIRTANNTFKIPEIILLNGYDKLPQQKTNFSRRTLFKRDNYQCQYCGIKPKLNEISLDHILPRSRNGKTTWENVVAACVECNAKKANRTPEEANMKLLKQPKKPTSIIHPHSTTKKRESWRHFMSEIYWSLELENDNED